MYNQDYTTKTRKTRAQQINSVSQSLNDFHTFQIESFKLINNKCDTLEDVTQAAENAISKLQQKVQYLAQALANNKIIQLKDKQNQFFVDQLKQRITKLQVQEQKNKQSLQKKQEQYTQLEFQVDKLAAQNLQLAKQIDRKSQQIKQLVKFNASLKSEIKALNLKNQPIDISFVDEPSKQNSVRAEQYDELQRQLKQIQTCLSLQIQEQRLKNSKLQEKILNMEMDMKNHSDSSKKSHELQFKLRAIQSQNKQLQELIQSLTNKNNENQIRLHQQIAQYNTNFHKLKGQFKAYKKDTQSLIKKISTEMINQLETKQKRETGNGFRGVILVGIKSLQQQFQEMKSILVKHLKRQIHSIILEKDLLIQQSRLDIQSKNTMINQLQAQIQKVRQRNTSHSGSIVNNHSGEFTVPAANGPNLMTNNSEVHNKTGISNSSSNKNKSLIQNAKNKSHETNKRVNQIREQIKSKQRQIKQLRDKYDLQQTNLRKQLLQKQQKILQMSCEYQFQQEQFQTKTKQAQESIKKYQEQINYLQTEKDRKEKQIRQLQNSVKIKNTDIIHQIKQKDAKIRQYQRALGQKQRKYKQKSAKIQQYQKQSKKHLANKEKTIQQLISKNQTLNIQIKLLNQKINLSQGKLAQQQEQNRKIKAIYQQKLKSYTSETNKKDEITQALNQINDIQQKDNLKKTILSLESKIKNYKQQIQSLQITLSTKSKKNNELQNQIFALQSSNHELSFQIKKLTSSNSLLKESVEKYKEQSQKQREDGFSRLKRQYEKNMTASKQEIEKIKNESEKLKKKYQKQSKTLKDQIKLSKQKIKNLQIKYEKSKQETQNKINLQIFKEQQRNFKINKQYEQKVQKLQKMLSQKHQENSNNVKDETADLLLKSKIVRVPQKLEVKQLSSKFKNTQSTSYQSIGVNTTQNFSDNIVVQQKQTQEKGINTVNFFQIIDQGNNKKSQFLKILDDSLGRISIKTDNIKQRPEKVSLKNSNLFANLQSQNVDNDDAFEICDQQQEINYGQSAVNLQIRQLFNAMRIEIQKLFNQEQVSMEIIKVLPTALQDDYFEFTAYVKQKIGSIKSDNQISFIAAIPGKEAEEPDQSLQLPELIQKRSEDSELKRVIEEKEAMISTLMNEKTSQQNTINQLTLEKEEIEQQNENRFMNQCNLYKKEIKQHKKMLDSLQMKFSSLKNVIKNVLQCYSQEDDMEDDFRDSMTIYARISQLNEKDRTRINYHIQRYRQIKGLQ